jgi:hypothetical protein
MQHLVLRASRLAAEGGGRVDRVTGAGRGTHAHGPEPAPLGALFRPGGRPGCARSARPVAGAGDRGGGPAGSGSGSGHGGSTDHARPVQHRRAACGGRISVRPAGGGRRPARIRPPKARAFQRRGGGPAPCGKGAPSRRTRARRTREFRSRDVRHSRNIWWHSKKPPPGVLLAIHNRVASEGSVEGCCFRFSTGGALAMSPSVIGLEGPG